MSIKSFSLVAFISILLFGTVMGFNMYKENKINLILSNKKEVSIPVVTEVIKHKSFIPKIEGVGFIASGTAVNISNELSGKIVEINFKSGQEVGEGDLLVKLDSRLEEAELKKVKATLPAVKSKYDRYQKLVKLKSISQESYEEAKSDYLSVEANIESLKVKIDLKRIIAPFDGIVGIRDINLGEFLNIGSNIIRLENIDTMTVKLSISQKHFLDLKIGQDVNVTPESIGTVYVGKVSAISPVINSKTGLFDIEITIPNELKQLRTGMYSNVSIDVEKKDNQIIIPQTSIQYALYGQSVFIVENTNGEERVKQVFVKIGDLIDSDVIILEGIKEGDRVVTNGQLKLSNNALIFESDDKTLQNMKIIDKL